MLTSVSVISLEIKRDINLMLDKVEQNYYDSFLTKKQAVELLNIVLIKVQDRMLEIQGK